MRIRFWGKTASMGHALLGVFIEILEEKTSNKANLNLNPK
jgi:hypothetical protein